MHKPVLQPVWRNLLILSKMLLSHCRPLADLPVPAFPRRSATQKRQGCSQKKIRNEEERRKAERQAQSPVQTSSHQSKQSIRPLPCQPTKISTDARPCRRRSAKRPGFLRLQRVSADGMVVLNFIMKIAHAVLQAPDVFCEYVRSGAFGADDAGAGRWGRSVVGMWCKTCPTREE